MGDDNDYEFDDDNNPVKVPNDPVTLANLGDKMTQAPGDYLVRRGMVQSKFQQQMNDADIDQLRLKTHMAALPAAMWMEKNVPGAQIVTRGLHNSHDMENLGHEQGHGLVQPPRSYDADTGDSSAYDDRPAEQQAAGPRRAAPLASSATYPVIRVPDRTQSDPVRDAAIQAAMEVVNRYRK